MMSRFRWTNSGVRMCSMFLSVPVSRLSTQITRWPRCSSSSQRCEPRKPAPPVTRLVGMALNLPLAAAATQCVQFATADRQLLGVKVLEQRLGEFPRGRELVAQLGEADRAGVAVG